MTFTISAWTCRSSELKTTRLVIPIGLKQVGLYFSKRNKLLALQFCNVYAYHELSVTVKDMFFFIHFQHIFSEQEVLILAFTEVSILAIEILIFICCSFSKSIHPQLIYSSTSAGSTFVEMLVEFCNFCAQINCHDYTFEFFSRFSKCVLHMMPC